MSTVPPLDTAKALYTAFAARDRAALLALMHPDIEWVQNHGFPGGGSHRGAEHVIDDVLGQFKRDWDRFGARISQWIDGGDTLVAIGGYEGTYKETGRSLDPPAAFAHVLDVRDGRVVRFRQFTDTALIRRAMGI